MLITSLLPLLSHYSLGLDLIAGPDGTVTLTIMPRRPEGATHKTEPGEIRPISITARAHEIDAELACGNDGALGQLIASRKTLAEQLAEHRKAADDARVTASEAAKVKTSSSPSKPSAPNAGSTVPAPTTPPVDAKVGEPASLW